MATATTRRTDRGQGSSSYRSSISRSRRRAEGHLQLCYAVPLWRGGDTAIAGKYGGTGAESRRATMQGRTPRGGGGTRKGGGGREEISYLTCNNQTERQSVGEGEDENCGRRRRKRRGPLRRRYGVDSGRGREKSTHYVLCFTHMLQLQINNASPSSSSSFDSPYRMADCCVKVQAEPSRPWPTTEPPVKAD